jgi:hypothetical protein
VPQPVVADNCAVDFFTNDYTGTDDASAVYPVGTTTVTWTVTDIHGNTASCQMDIVVSDVEDPAITCPADIAVDADPGLCEAAVTVPQPAVADNCAVDFFTNDYTGTDNASAVYPVGTTTVTWTVTDIHGNTASCQMQVVVSDTEDPAVTCPADINVDADPAVCEALVSVPQPAVSDNCAVDFFTNDYTGTDDASAVYPVGTTTVTWTVTDIHGNTASCQMEVVVSDVEDPTVTCPSDIAVSADPGLCEAAVTVPQPAVADNCAVDFFTNDYTGTDDASAVYPVGTTTVTWTVTDIHGNTASCQMDIVVVSDVEDPAVTCPADIAVPADPGLCEAAVTVPQPAVADNCAVDFFTNDYTGTDDASAVYPVGTTTVTWTVTDIHGNTASCQMQVVVSDVEDPVVTCPADITQPSDAGSCDALVSVPLPQVSDNCGVASVVNNYTGSEDATGTYTVGNTLVTWTITDIHGNESTCATNILVTDLELPVIGCPTAIAQTADSGVCSAFVTVPLPQVTENCAISSVINDYTGVEDASATYPVGITNVTWTVTDLAGNTAQCSITIEVTDDELPVIDCPADITQTADAGLCSAAVTVPQPVTSDNCGIAQVVNDYTNTSDATAVYPVGTTIINWTVTDIHGNTSGCSMSITVTDNEAPQNLCVPSVTQTADPGVCDAFVALSVPTVSDNCGVDMLTNDYNGTGDATDTYPVGTTMVTWTLTDIHGNATTCTTIVTVTDDEQPVIICPSDVLQTADAGTCDAYVGISVPVASDNCGIASFANDYNGTTDATDTYPVGTTTVTWLITDNSGNSSQCAITVTITDDELPVITCPADIAQPSDTGMCDALINVPLPGVSDNCQVATVTNDYNNTSDATDTYPVGTTTVNWTVTDIHGNTSSCSMTIVVTDEEDPQISCPADITVPTDSGVCGALVTVPAPGISDNCGIQSVINDYNGTADASGDYPVGTTTVNWTLTDIHGNISQCAMTVTVNDTEAPVVQCAADLDVPAEQDLCEAALVVGAPAVSDNCAVATVVNDYNGTSDASDVYPVGLTLVTWTVTDVHGNISTCTQTIRVNDVETPDITCPADISQNADAGVCSAGVSVGIPVTSDNCGIASVVNDYTLSEDATGTYPVGTTVVQWTVTDLHGNTNTCSTTIVISDVELPVITCPQDISVTTDADACGALVNVPTPANTDNCGVATIVNTFNGTSDASGFYPTGITLIEWTVTDVHGNLATCTMQVTVTDDQLPGITCPADITVPNDAGICGALVNYDLPAISDNCGDPILTLISGPDTGEFFPAGTTEVIWQAEDSSGNISVCSFTVTVEDTEAPVIVCPADLIVSNDTGQCGAVVLFSTPRPPKTADPSPSSRPPDLLREVSSPWAPRPSALRRRMTQEIPPCVPLTSS